MARVMAAPLSNSPNDTRPARNGGAESARASAENLPDHVGDRRPVRSAATAADGKGATAEKRLTLFAIPKPFVGHVGVIQRNAIKSWTLLGDSVEILLFGNEIGTEQYAEELGVRHFPDIETNHRGTPLLSEVFAIANQVSSASFLLYVNSDILLLPDTLEAVDRVQTSDMTSFLLIGRRTDLDFEEMIDFEDSSWADMLRTQAHRAGQLAPVVCKDFFGFPRGQYDQIPSFAIGRGNWDNWLVHHSRTSGIPVVDATAVLTAIHQNHDYTHLAQGRLEAYVKGVEAKENQRLAGGRHLVSGCASNWKLDGNGLTRKRTPVATAFLRDLPRFTRLMRDIFRPRRHPASSHAE